ncbi:MAG: PQQ-binding-like beta-propeller repeat protein [Planctomycetes bacterium]|nr:PQQ-binding-like beta-propeller repeat protein [Planctomycetota bacterium]
MPTRRRRLPRAILGALLVALATALPARAADQPQWGQAWSRNMVSDETGLPDTFDPAAGKNLKWDATIGNETYGTPVIAGGKVFIGTNHGNPRDARHQGDYGVLMCLDEKDGSLGWQLVVPKIGGDPLLDWPSAGLCSPPTVEGNRVYVVSNRGEVMCLDIRGQANGNDGPYTDEGKHMAPKGAAAMEVTAIDADIVWMFDLVTGVGMHTHDASHASILVDGPLVYLNTSNGVDSTHRKIITPDAPALIALDKATGRLVARDDEHMGSRTFHCTWSSPAMGEVNGQRQIFFGGPDGICYAFEPLAGVPPAGKVETLKRLWRFDGDPTAPKEDIHRTMPNRRDSPSNIKGMPVFYKDRVYVAAGGDIWWGKRQAWIKCIDATKTGDITDGGLVWSYPLSSHCCSTPSIAGGLLFISDCGRTVHCVDAETGKPYWTHETRGDMWGSTLVADGKVYVGTRRGDFYVFAADKEKRVLSSVELDSAVCSTPVAANGVLYVTTQSHLYAFQKREP